MQGRPRNVESLAVLLEGGKHFGKLPRRGDTLSDTTGAHRPQGADKDLAVPALALTKRVYFRNDFLRLMRGRVDHITPFALSSAFTGSIQRNSTWPLWPGLYLWRFFRPASGRRQGHPQASFRDGRHVLEDRDPHLDFSLPDRELVETCATCR